MVALSSWIEKEESAVADTFSRLGETPPEPKNRIRRFFSGSPDRIGDPAPQVVDRVGETRPAGYDSRRGYVLAQKKNPYEGLPPCSELRAKIDSGELKPRVTAQSFIEQPSVMGFQGDDRGFLDSPASASSRDFRVHGSIGYGDSNATIAGGVSSFGPIYVGGAGGSGAVGGPTYVSRQSRPTGGGSVTRDGYEFSFSFEVTGSDGLFFELAPNAIQRGAASVNYNTGAYLAVLSHTEYPAAQVFLNNTSIYNYSSDQFGKGPFDLGEGNVEQHIVAGYACDPTK